MKKKGFTLFEVMVSLVLLGIAFSIVFKIFTDKDSIETYYELQTAENEYIQNQTINNTSKIQYNLK